MSIDSGSTQGQSTTGSGLGRHLPPGPQHEQRKDDRQEAWADERGELEEEHVDADLRQLLVLLPDTLEAQADDVHGQAGQDDQDHVLGHEHPGVVDPDLQGFGDEVIQEASRPRERLVK